MIKCDDSLQDDSVLKPEKTNIYCEDRKKSELSVPISQNNSQNYKDRITILDPTQIINEEYTINMSSNNIKPVLSTDDKRKESGLEFNESGQTQKLYDSDEYIESNPLPEAAKKVAKAVWSFNTENIKRQKSVE